MAKTRDTEITQTELGDLKALKRSLGLRKFKFANDRSYTQWTILAENLTIRLFGEKSNQLNQFRSAISAYEQKQLGGWDSPLGAPFQTLDEDTLAENDLKTCIRHTQVFKDKMRDILGAWIKEAEKHTKPETSTSKNGVQNAGAKNVQIQTTNITLNVSIDQTIEVIMGDIRAGEHDEERIKEAEKHLKTVKIPFLVRVEW